MKKSTSADSKVGSMSVSMTQHVTPGAVGRLDSIHKAFNMGDQNIGILQQILTGLYNLVQTLEQKIHHLSQNGTANLIRGSSTDAPRDDIEVRLSTLTAEFYGLRHLTKGGGFNTIVGDLNSLTDFTVWVRVNLPSDTPKFEHFIDLDILLAGI